MKVTFLGLCLLAFLFTFTTQTFAVDFTVNLTTDQHDANLADGVCDIGAGTGQCSLRAAVEQANNLASDDRVFFNLPANSTITLTTGNDGDISIGGSLNTYGALEINGTGANNLTIDGGAGTNRIFSFRGGSSTIISGVTLTGGNGTSAIPYIIERPRIGPNVQDSGNGGAIFFYKSTLTLDGVHVTGNSASNEGGGLYFTFGTLRIINSTFSANTANSCGGFELRSYSTNTFATVVNSTISGNTAANSGGGLCNNNSISFALNVTITNNTALEGGGIYLSGNALKFGNTIVAGNTATGGFGPEIYIPSPDGVPSLGGNLIGDSPGDSANVRFSAAYPGIYQPTDILDTNPQLDILRYNGGTTPTHRLFADSPAIDRGLNSLAVVPSYDNYVGFSLSNGTLLVFDQRGAGFPRIVDGNNDGIPTVDIGAFEVQPVVVLPTKKEQCENGGWMTFTMPRTFKNQGDCIQFVNTGK